MATQAQRIKELEAKLEAAEAAKAAAEKAAQAATKRVYYQANLFANLKREKGSHPAWQGNIRLEAERPLKKGEHIWFNVNQWDADPSRFEDGKTIPDFSMSMFVTDPAYAKELEERRQLYLLEQAHK